MNVKNIFLFVRISILFTVFTYAASLDNSNLKQIIDFENELSVTTPLQSSIVPLKSYFDSQENVPGGINAPKVVQNNLELDAFNKTFFNYIKEYYNKPEFTDILTYDATDICQFLQISFDFNLDSSATYVVLRLFYNKIKSCDFILNKATNSVIEGLNEGLGRFFENVPEDIYKEEIQIIRKNLGKIILGHLTDQFAQLRFLEKSNIAKQISDDVFRLLHQGVNNLQKKHAEEKTKERLRQMIIRFTEMLLEKTIWDERNSEDIWTSFQLLSDNLQKLALNGIIDEMDDIDDLLWTLTHSFCRFFNSFGITVPTAVYEAIEFDLKKNAIYFLEQPEQEAGIRTKKEHIYDALFKSKIKAYAFEKKGIIAQ